MSHHQQQRSTTWNILRNPTHQHHQNQFYLNHHQKYLCIHIIVTCCDLTPGQRPDDDGVEQQQLITKMSKLLRLFVVIHIATSLLLFFAAAAATASSEPLEVDDLPPTADEEPDDNLTPPTTTIEEDSDSAAASAATSLFINSVHAIAANVSKNLTIHDTKVVWSPFAVVSAINAFNNLKRNNNGTAAAAEPDGDILDTGFNSATTYIRSLSPSLNATLVTGAFTRDEEVLKKAAAANSSSAAQQSRLLVTTWDPSTADINDVLQDAFINLTSNTYSHTAPPLKNTTTTNITTTEADPIDPHRLLVPGSKSTYLLTSLGLSASWSTPFHPRYAKKAKFFLNSTHIVKTKFLNNIAFLKFANLTLSSSDDVTVDASAVAVPLKDVHKTYLVLVKPHNPDHFDLLSAALDDDRQQHNFTRLFSSLRTKRVQLSVPKFNIDSQFILPVSETTSMLHISSLKLTYAGLSHNFAPPPTANSSGAPSATVGGAIKFTRLRRRKDDVRFKVNSPFIFYVYDASISGILLSGLVLNPIGDDHHAHSQQGPPPSMAALPPALETLKTSSNNFCMDLFQFSRRRASITDNILVPCVPAFKRAQVPQQQQQQQFLSTLEAMSVGSSRVNSSHLVFTLGGSNTMKKSIKKFFSDEVNYTNATFLELESPKVKYLSYPALDMKVLRVHLPNTRSQFIYLFSPNERSGVSVIEDGLDLHPLGGSRPGGGGVLRFQSILCQMRDVHRRVRVPLINIRAQNDIVADISDFTSSSSSNGTTSDGGSSEVGTTTTDDNRDQVIPTSLVFQEDNDNGGGDHDDVTSSSAAVGVAPPSGSGGNKSRTARGSKGGSSSTGGGRRYRKTYLDRSFIFIITEEVNSRGAFVAIGRVVVPQQGTPNKPPPADNSSSSGSGNGSSEEQQQPEEAATTTTSPP